MADTYKVASAKFTVRNVNLLALFVKPLRIFSDILKVLELYEYRRGDPYMTANMNFVHFAHSFLLSFLQMTMLCSSFLVDSNCDTNMLRKNLIY